MEILKNKPKEEEIKIDNIKKSLQEQKVEEIQKEEDILIKDYLSSCGKSIEGSTSCSLSQDENYNCTSKIPTDLSSRPNYIIKNNYEKIEKNSFLNKNKMDISPMFEYYKGFDEILKMKNNENIEIHNSKNFIKKSNFLNSKEKIEIEEKKEIKNKSNFRYYLKMDNKFNIEFNNIDNINNISIYNFIDSHSNYYNSNKNSDILNIINNINNNINKNCYTFSYNKSIRNKKGKNKNENIKEYKFSSRKGDWTCQCCFNINFSFRTFCNRCGAFKKN